MAKQKPTWSMHDEWAKANMSCAWWLNKSRHEPCMVNEQKPTWLTETKLHEPWQTVTGSGSWHPGWSGPGHWGRTQDSWRVYSCVVNTASKTGVHDLVLATSRDSKKKTAWYWYDSHGKIYLITVKKFSATWSKMIVTKLGSKVDMACIIMSTWSQRFWRKICIQLR
jgi:hypothetical protein